MPTPLTSSSAKNSKTSAVIVLLRRIPKKHLIIIGGIVLWFGTIAVTRSISRPRTASTEQPQQQAQDAATAQKPGQEDTQQPEPPPQQQAQGGMQQSPADQNMTLAQEAWLQARAEFYRHWTVVNDTTHVYTTKNGTSFEVAKMTINQHFYPISEVDKLNGIEMKARYLFAPTIFRISKNGRPTDWLSGEPGYIAMHPMAPKPPTTIIILQKRSGQWTSNATLPLPDDGSSGPTLDDVLEKIRRGPVP